MAHAIQPRDDFPPEFLQELARVVIEFGRLEYMIKLALKRLTSGKKGENRVDWSTGRAVEVHELMPPQKELADVRVKLDEMTNRISST